MCKSVRGAAYFGASIHMALSFIFLIWFVFDTLISEININLWKCDPPEQKFSEVNPIAHYFNLLFKLLYFTGLCVTGVYIFRGVEREKPTILKFATLAFAILQMVGVVLFAVFFTIQWEAAPDYDRPSSALVPTDSIHAAQLVGQEPPSVPGESPAPSPSSPQSSSDLTQNENKCNNMALIITPSDTNADEADTAMENVLKDVTPGISENVLVAPDINDTTTTTTAMPPPPPPPEVVAAAIPTTTTPKPLVATQTPEVAPLPCTTPECANARGPPSLPMARKVPHNQLVRLVLSMCFAISNGLFSLAYVIILAFYMLKL